MINLYDEAAIQREMAIQTRAMMILERSYRKIMTAILNEQYRYAASLVEHGETHFDGAIIRGQDERINKAKSEYIRAGKYFAERTLSKLKVKKTPLEEALYNTAQYASIYAARNIDFIDNKTKDIIRSLISKGLLEHKTLQEIASEIRKTSIIINPSRAQTIAQTEIHSVVSFSTQEAARSSGYVMRKKWFNVYDHRTRNSHKHMNEHPTINMNQKYEVEKYDGDTLIGIEFLSYPGDPLASKGNIINCRCNQLFYTR